MKGMNGKRVPVQNSKIQYKISTEIESGFFSSTIFFSQFRPSSFFLCLSIRLLLGSNKWSVRAWFSITSHQIAFFHSSTLVTVLLSLEYAVVRFDCVLIFVVGKSDYFNPRLFSN